VGSNTDFDNVFIDLSHKTRGKSSGRAINVYADVDKNSDISRQKVSLLRHRVMQQEILMYQIIKRISEDVIDISYLITACIAYESVLLFNTEIVERAPPFIDNEVLHEITGNHKRRKEFFIHRICRAQLYFV